MEDTQVMAAPTYVATGNGVQSTTTISVVWPTPHQVDDIGILFLESAAQTPATPSGWTLIGGTSTGTPGDDAATGLWAYWKRATSAAEANAEVADVGDHVRGRILLFRGCETSGSPISGTPVTGEAATATTAVSISCPAPLVDETLVVSSVSNSIDTTGNLTVTTDWANSSLTDFARRSSGNHASGNGGGFDTATGVKAVAGVVSATTTILATASAQAKLAFALMPPQGGGGGGAITEGGIFVATGIKTLAGAVSATTATLDAASAQARVVIALKPVTAPPVNLPPVVTAVTDKVAAIDVELSFALEISDPEGDTLTVSLVAGTTDVPSGAAVNENPDGSYDFSWTPSSAQAGEWNIILRVTDGTNTVDRQFSIAVAAEPDTTLLEVARGIAERAEADLESAEALSDMLDETQQMNANVIKEVRELIADLQASKAYMAQVIADLEEQETEE
jgi:hypothetical protein